MDKTDRELFGQALAEALAERLEEELAECEESAVCSQAHYEKMQEIINPSRKVCKRKFSRKSLVAIIVAAALLLTGCAAYICRNEIREFVEDAYEKFVRLTYSESYKKSSSEIDEIYKLTYVPDGYELVEEKLETISKYYKYTNSNGEFILFKQVVLDTTEVGLDVEEGYTGLYEFDGLKIYCRVLDTSFHYVWNDGKYALYIISSSQFDEKELEKLALCASKIE